MSIRYYSTNHRAPEVSFRDALLNGQAPDRGLYMPEFIPTLTPELLASFENKSYSQIACDVLSVFLEEDISSQELKAICESAYNFNVPLETVTDILHILRLDQGPTASFKDFAARMMARLMQYYLKQTQKKMLILVATSGDTGSAIANAYYGLENINVVVLFPKDEVSDRQRKQMTTLHKNINVLALNGKFDDCQALVKEAFSDRSLRNLNLSSANSINFGRLLPQSIYYIYAWAKLAEKNQSIIFSIPSGNFGNMMGAVLAKKMGVPIEKLLIATNENDAFPRFLKSTVYQKIVPSINCLSNAMNVGHPSNLARLIDFFGGALNEKGELLQEPDMQQLSELIFSQSVTDQETIQTIQSVYQRYNTLLEPHGAVGWKVLEDYLDTYNSNLENKLFVLAETAHPAKFPDTIRQTLGKEPDLPVSLKNLDSKTESFIEAEADYKSFKTYLTQHF